MSMIRTGNKDLIPTVDAVYLMRSADRSHTIAQNSVLALQGCPQAQLPLVVVGARVDQAFWVQLMTSKMTSSPRKKG